LFQLVSIKNKTSERLEKEAENKYKDKHLQKLDDIKNTQLATMGGIANLLKDAIKSFSNVKTINITNPESKVAPIDLSSTNTLLKGLYAATKALKLNVKVEAPIVKVPQTKLTIEKVDLSEIKQPLLDVVNAVKAIPKAEIEIEPTDTSLIEDKLDKSNQLLKKIADKKISAGGGGGGGGNGTPYTDDTGALKNVILQNGSIPVIPQETAPIDTSKLNGSLVLGYNTGILVTLTKVIGATSYQKTLSYTGTDLTGVSSWVEL